jgi:hypothetical protein
MVSVRTSIVPPGPCPPPADTPGTSPTATTAQATASIQDFAGSLDRTLILNQAHLRAVLAEYQEHYNTARPHQGTGQRIPGADPGPPVTTADPGTWQIRRKPVLSGLINEYERAA